jgi:xanthine dehydrogenase accessory factor
VRDDGSTAGTVGGGRVEADVQAAAREVMETGKPRRLSFDLGANDSLDGGPICGGQVEVLVEPILPVPRVFIFGAGHISKSLSKIAALAGFSPIVIDDRAEFANSERFPDAEAVHAAAYEDVFPGLPIDAGSYIVIVTRGHQDDARVLRLAAGTPARYVAMVGSRRKVASVTRELQEGGVPRAALERLYAPMGLDIGAIFPEEIAVSVVAEMIAVRRNAQSNWRSLSMSAIAAARPAIEQ